MTDSRPAHAPLIQFGILDDQLVIGGQSLDELALQAGQTPFYVYEREAIRRRVAALRAVMPERLAIHYAVKANPMPGVVDLLAALVEGLDVASLGEQRLALASGVAAADISFAGPGKTDVELEAAVAAGVTMNLESAGELERTAAIGDRLGLQPQVAVRVNPDFELRSSGMRMGGGARPFGIDAEQVPAVLRRLGELGLHFRGLQVFSGSQNLNASSLVEAQDATFDLAYRLADAAPSGMETLNIGGGLGVPYFPGEARLDLQPLADNLARRIEAASQRLGPVQVIMELGRYLVAEAGAYVCRVIDRKVSRGTTYLVTDGGLHHHLAASGNFGQVIRKNYPVVNPAAVCQGPREQVDVVGPLCTPLDILGDRVELGTTDVGDLLVVLQSGAYGFSASPHRFLGHPPPVELLV
jgi:diaminopimelate decarboxylase